MVCGELINILVKLIYLRNRYISIIFGIILLVYRRSNIRMIKGVFFLGVGWGNSESRYFFCLFNIFMD